MNTKNLIINSINSVLDLIINRDLIIYINTLKEIMPVNSIDKKNKIIIMSNLFNHKKANERHYKALGALIIKYNFKIYETL